MASMLARRKAFSLRVFDVRPEACDEAVSMGARRAETPHACADGAGVLVLAVVNAQRLAAVLFDGPGAVFSAGGFSGECVVCSTVSPGIMAELAEKVASHGATLVDAPMSGGTTRAAKGELALMVAAPPAALERCRPVLEAMGKVFVLGERPGLGSSMKLVNQVLAGVHLAVAAEAMTFAARLGLNTRQVFDIIVSAAGNSFLFENRVPHMLDDDQTPHSALDIWPKDLGIVLDEARRLGFPCPMAGQALQQFLAGKALGLGAKDDSFVVKVYEAYAGGARVAVPAKPPQQPGAEAQGPAEPPAKVAFVGLGAMGRGMASCLVERGPPLSVYDVRPEAADELVKRGARRADSPCSCAEGADVLVVAVVNAQQVSQVLFDGPGAVFAGSFRGVCVVCSTLSPAFMAELAAKVAGRGAVLVDAPMSGGTLRAARGDLTFMVSGPPPALARCRFVLEAMGKYFVLGTEPGLGSGMKLVNQVLAGTHIVAAAEAMALAARQGLDTRQVFDIIVSAAGNSFMFENRVPHMLDDDPTPHSALDIWPKDLGIVLDEARRLGFPCPMAGQALQQYLAGKALGLGSKDDSFVVKVYEAQASTVHVAKRRRTEA
uniref:3-hydroxyisobutyrate dehydrogenase n=1 Tax=Alexandrium monilatum TaxID=311494 RepID=A0A7S4RHS5_9DINO